MPLRWGKTRQKVSETKSFIFKQFINRKKFQKKFLKEENLSYILVPNKYLY